MQKYNVKFKKKFGQNFLKNKDIVKHIIDVSGVDGNSLVVEVGPGGAVLTCELAKVAKNVLAYEIDSDLSFELSRKLDCYRNVDVIFQDFLDSTIEKDVKNYKYNKLLFVSNVPYYITTPIVMKILYSKLKFDKITMMVQKEVGDRFTSLPGTKNYSSITVFLNYFYDIKKEFNVSRKNFVPVPNVDSVVISFVERENKFALDNFDFFESLVRDSFQFRRKNLKNNLNGYNLEVVEEVLKKYNYDLTVRAEMLSVGIFVEIANALLK